VKTARDFIARAIALNPDAHFGREPYQLKIMNWILAIHESPPDSSLLPSFVDFSPGKDDPHAAVVALSGLIMLGNAWESVDVYNALVQALDADHERTSVALLVRERCLELIREGKGSLVPGAPKGNELASRIAQPFNVPSQKEDLPALFRSLRVEADLWHKARTDYMTERLRRGEHPDLLPTKAAFWADFAEPAPPELGPLVLSIALRVVPPSVWPVLGFLGEVGLLAALFGFLLRKPIGRVVRPGYRSAWSEPHKGR
jgi:hypothetical protein